MSRRTTIALSTAGLLAAGAALALAVRPARHDVPDVAAGTGSRRPPRVVIAGGGYVGYARGTSNARRGLAWVGENGPELIRFHGGEQVIPNDKLGSAGAGATYVFSPTYYDDGRSVRRDMEDWRHEMAGAFS